MQVPGSKTVLPQSIALSNTLSRVKLSTTSLTKQDLEGDINGAAVEQRGPGSKATFWLVRLPCLCIVPISLFACELDLHALHVAVRGIQIQFVFVSAIPVVCPSAVGARGKRFC